MASPAAAAIGLPLSVPACGHELRRAVEIRREMAHDVAPPRHRGEREAAADDLAEGDHVRHHAVVFLGAAVGEAEAGDDLVEDQRARRAAR